MCGNGCVQKKHFPDFEQLYSDLDKFNMKTIKFLVFSPNHPLFTPAKETCQQKIFSSSLHPHPKPCINIEMFSLHCS